MRVKILAQAPNKHLIVAAVAQKDFHLAKSKYPQSVPLGLVRLLVSVSFIEPAAFGNAEEVELRLSMASLSHMKVHEVIAPSEVSEIRDTCGLETGFEDLTNASSPAIAEYDSKLLMW